MIHALQFAFSQPEAYVYALGHILLVLFVIAPGLKWGSLGYEVNGNLVTLRLPGGALALIPPLPEIMVYGWLSGSPYSTATAIAAHMLVVRTILWVPTFLLVAALRLTGHEVDLGCIDNRVNGQFAGVSECALHMLGCGAFTTLAVYGLFPFLAAGAAVYALQGASDLSDTLMSLWWLPLFFVGAKLLHIWIFAILSDIVMVLTEAIGWGITSLIFQMRIVLQPASWHTHANPS